MTIHREHRSIGTFLAGIVAVAGLIVGAGHADAVRTSASVSTASVSTPPPTPAARSVAALTDRDGPRVLAELPADFAEVMGYRPQVVDGRAVNPAGGCSSPVRLPRRFESLCREHDLGYDLLRYADRTGEPLGSWARLDLDQMLTAAMAESCHDPACLTAAELARVGLALNTWRQYDGPPARAESVPDILGSLVGRSWTMMTDATSGAGK